ncbi:hypothetical protein NQ314_004936 [Rhamnusium bicolor]|uniref:Uncharacterized protein n=1 Tax=Rhamnusium bicolor TaxID=1586634 RepID=A0AAV8ZKP4_9CUCU|nr:hypothetical protein NQ314_004936 [Rhamnusium bicolor]
MLYQYNFVSNRILDLVLCNKLCNVVYSPEILLKEDCHHPALLIAIDSEVEARYFSLSNSKNDELDLNYKKVNFHDLSLELSLTDWSSLSSVSDTDNGVDIFYNILRQILIKHVLEKSKLNYSRQFLRCFSKDVIYLWKAKEKVKKKYKLSKRPEDHDEFKRLRSSLITEVYEKFVENNLKNC